MSCYIYNQVFCNVYLLLCETYINFIFADKHNDTVTIDANYTYNYNNLFTRHYMYKIIYTQHTSLYVTCFALLRVAVLSFVLSPSA